MSQWVCRPNYSESRIDWKFVDFIVQREWATTLKRAWNQKVGLHIGAAVIAAFTNATAVASDIAVVSSCPQRQHIPVEFKIDCSHLKDPATRKLCDVFGENQACRVFPAYRKITGINIERLCPTIRYTLYDRANWPYGPIGGVSFRCRIDQLAEYALRSNVKSTIGPHEFHEMLHQYQMAHKVLGQLTALHPLFSSSMLEAERELGEGAAYESGYERLKQEVQRMQMALTKGTIRGAGTCGIAQAVVEESLYLRDRSDVYLFYRTLAKDASRNPLDQISEMLNALSGGTIKQFLLAHGCREF
jgi:hypothetical protein